VVSFFASWCTACQAELPGFRQEASALQGKVIFIGVDSLETGDKNFLPNLFHLVGSFAALACDVGPDGGGLHAALGGGNTMPLTAFYGCRRPTARRRAHRAGPGRRPPDQDRPALRRHQLRRKACPLEDSTSFVKVLADPATRLLLGAHLIGPQASTLIQPLIQAMCLGNTVDQVASGVLYIHPALTEVVEQALLAL
jgi:hypothetical protein